MAEKTVSKHLINLEKYFSSSSSILKKASSVFHELDQLEYELGLIDDEESTARKSSWWPIVSFMGGFSSAKSDFITRYLETNLHASNHKFTVYQYTPQENNATLLGSALDADHRLPFYQVSKKLEQVETGHGKKVNAYLELKTVNSLQLKGKLFIDTPVINTDQTAKVQPMLMQHVSDMSDLVLVFTDLFDATPELIQDTIDDIVKQQDSNKFIYVIDHSEISLDNNKIQEITVSWQRRLAELGIHTGQFLVLSENNDDALMLLEQRLKNIENDRSYRVLNTLEQSINHINETYIPEVEKYLILWKDRLNMSTFIFLGFIVFLILFAEITFGVLDLLLDPIIGPIFLVIMTAITIPIHLIIAKVHAKFIIKSLQKRQKELNITENIAGIFEKSLTFWRILLPINEVAGNNKKIQQRITVLVEKTKDMVQALNDQFSYEQSNQKHETFND